MRPDERGNLAAVYPMAPYGRGSGGAGRPGPRKARAVPPVPTARLPPRPPAQRPARTWGRPRRPALPARARTDAPAGQEGRGRGLIPGRRGIETRPPEVELRIAVGHWEGDLVVGAGATGYLVTLVERGTNENTNGLIRRLFPKSESFAAIGEAGLLRIDRFLNDRPRKCLGWLTGPLILIVHKVTHSIIRGAACAEG